MDTFKIITPIIYWLLILVWAYILIFYIRKLSAQKTSDKFFRLLLIILAIDAFRTLFESAYFGAWYTSLSDIIPISVYNFLAQPEIVFYPKIFNLIASFLVLFMIIRKWIPEETNRIITFNKLLKERTKVLENESHTLRTETQIAHENETKYKNATTNSPFPIMIHAEDGEVILVNKSWTKLSGYKLEDISTISEWTKKAYGAKSENVKEYIDKLYQLNEAKEEGEYTIKTKSGEEQIWAFSSAPLDVLPDGRRMVISSAMDVSERKKVEKKVIARETKLQTTFDAANNVAFILTSFEGKDSKIIEFSKGAENIFGYKANEVIGKPVAMLHLAEDVANFDELQKSIFKNKEGVSGESMLIRKSGEKFPALFSLYPVVDELGKTNSFQGVSIDISELKTAEKALVESKTLLETTGRVAKVGGWSIDIDSQELKWTEEVFRLHELPLDFVPTVDQGINFYHPDDRSIIAHAVQDAMENSKPFNVELRIVTAKKNVKWINARGNILKTETTKIIGTFQDITERKLASIEIRKSEKRYRDLILNLDAGIVIHSKDSSILFNNHRASELLGLTDKQMMGKQAIDPNWKFIHEDHSPLQLDEYPVIQITNSKKSIKNIILGVIKPETNEISWLTVNGFPILKENSEIEEILISFVEITEQKIASEEIQKLNNELEQRVNERTDELSNSQAALLNIVEDLNEKSELLELSSNDLETKNKELESFTYSVSHDLKAPLRAVIGFSQILKEDFAPQLNSESKRYIDLIIDNAENMGTLIKDLLNFSRMARTELQKTQVDLSILGHRVKSELIIDIKDRNLTINIMDMPLVNADEKLIYHVMLNLISNAVKFTAKAENAIVEIGCSNINNENVFYVKDNGIGFNMKYAGKIFDVFQRLHSVEEFPGTGIGLSIVQRIIHKHGGRVWVESEINIGTTFFFTV